SNMEIYINNEILDKIARIVTHEINETALSSGHTLNMEPSVCTDVAVSNDSSTSAIHAQCRLHNSLANVRRRVFKECEDSSWWDNYISYRSHDNPTDLVSQDVVEEQNRQSFTLSAYVTYISFIGRCFFYIVAGILTTAVAIDKVLGVRVAKWSDFIISMAGNDERSIINTPEMMRIHDNTATEITIMGVIFVGLIFLGMFMAVFGNIHASRKIHDFIMKSVFQKHVGLMKVKESLATTITFLSSDMYYIDEHVGRFMIATLFSLLSICIQLFTICYSEPIISPIPAVLITILYMCFVKTYLIASKKLQWLMLDANASINAVYGDVMSGSDIYRSFSKERLCMERVYRNSEAYFRIKFLKIASTVWAMLTCKLFNNVMLLCISIVPVLYSYVKGEDMKAAKLGLGISYSLGINTLLTSLIYNLTSLEN
ncbi:putative ATP-BINDING CASSETTE TRANSPORTER, partial [Babesia divergens]